MSKKTRLAKLPRSVQRVIQNELFHNGWSWGDINGLWSKLTVADVSDVIEVEELLMEMA